MAHIRVLLRKLTCLIQTVKRSTLLWPLDDTHSLISIITLRSSRNTIHPVIQSACNFETVIYQHMAESKAPTLGAYLSEIYDKGNDSKREWFKHDPHLDTNRANHIIIYRGSFNPPHRGHLALLEHGYRQLSIEFNVVAAFINISSDESLKDKIRFRSSKQRHLDFETRVALWREDPHFPPWAWVHEGPRDDISYSGLRREIKSLGKREGCRIRYIDLYGPDCFGPASDNFGEITVISDVAREATWDGPSGLQSFDAFGAWSVSRKASIVSNTVNKIYKKRKGRNEEGEDSNLIAGDGHGGCGDRQDRGEDEKEDNEDSDEAYIGDQHNVENDDGFIVQKREHDSKSRDHADKIDRKEDDGDADENGNKKDMQEAEKGEAKNSEKHFGEENCNATDVNMVMDVHESDENSPTAMNKTIESQTATITAPLDPFTLKNDDTTTKSTREQVPGHRRTDEPLSQQLQRLSSPSSMAMCWTQSTSHIKTFRFLRSTSEQHTPFREISSTAIQEIIQREHGFRLRNALKDLALSPGLLWESLLPESLQGHSSSFSLMYCTCGNRLDLAEDHSTGHAGRGLRSQSLDDLPLLNVPKSTGDNSLKSVDDMMIWVRASFESPRCAACKTKSLSTSQRREELDREGRR